MTHEHLREVSLAVSIYIATEYWDDALASIIPMFRRVIFVAVAALQ